MEISGPVEHTDGPRIACSRRPACASIRKGSQVWCLGVPFWKVVPNVSEFRTHGCGFLGYIRGHRRMLTGFWVKIIHAALARVVQEGLRQHELTGVISMGLV